MPARGEEFTYTVVVANNGPAAANGASVTDTMPAGLSADTWSAAEANGATGSVGSGSGNISDPALDMPSGSTVTYTVAGHGVVLSVGVARQQRHGDFSDRVGRPQHRQQLVH